MNSWKQVFGYISGVDDHQWVEPVTEEEVIADLKRKHETVNISADVSDLRAALSRFFKMAALLIALMLVSLLAAAGLREEVLTSREANAGGRAVVCLNLLLNPDRDFPMPKPCADGAVVANYPPGVCERIEHCEEP